jgi:carbon monoxide dehydrogenase subunit G
MSIRLNRSYEVQRPVTEVWGFLTDPHCIAGCLPGAHLLDIEDGRLLGEVDLSFGPFGTTLHGEAGFEEMDDDVHSVLMAATARESKGDGGADLRMRSRLAAAGEASTRVEVDLQVRLAGRLDGPILGRLLAGAAEILLRRFVACVRSRLEAADATSA